MRRGGAHDVGLVDLIGCIGSCTGFAKSRNNAYEIFLSYGYEMDVMHTGCLSLVLTAWGSGQLSLGCCQASICLGSYADVNGVRHASVYNNFVKDPC